MADKADHQGHFEKMDRCLLLAQHWFNCIQKRPLLSNIQVLFVLNRPRISLTKIFSIAFNICSIKRIIKLMGEKNCCEKVPGFQWRKSSHLFRCIWNLSHLFLSIACRPSWNRKYISVFELKYVPIFVWLSYNLKFCNIRFYVEVIFVGYKNV